MHTSTDPVGTRAHITPACVLPTLRHTCRHTLLKPCREPPKHACKKIYGAHTNQKQPIYNAKHNMHPSSATAAAAQKNSLLARRGGYIDFFHTKLTGLGAAGICVQCGGVWVSNRPSCLQAGCSSEGDTGGARGGDRAGAHARHVWGWCLRV